MTKAKPYDDIIKERLKDPEYCLEYLNASLAENEPSQFLLALRRVADSKGISLGQIAESTGINREGLYRILSEKGNPEWKTLFTLLHALGFDLKIATSINQLAS